MNVHNIAVLHLTIISSIFCSFVPKRDVYFEFYSSNADSTDIKLTKARFDAGYVGLHIQIPFDFDSNKQTFLYIHGYMSSASTQPDHAKSFFNTVQKGPFCCNFIVLNWTEGNSTPRYYLMKDRSRSVSNYELIIYIHAVYFTHLPLCQHLF